MRQYVCCVLPSGNTSYNKGRSYCIFLNSKFSPTTCVTFSAILSSAVFNAPAAAWIFAGSLAISFEICSRFGMEASVLSTSSGLLSAIASQPSLDSRVILPASIADSITDSFFCFLFGSLFLLVSRKRCRGGGEVFL